jgi:Flp pilus assembly protein TadG
MKRAMAAHFLRLIDGLADFLRDQRAVSAVEFGFLLPVMVTLYLGTVEVSRGIWAKRNVTLTAHALADLTSQYTTVHDQDLSNILAAGSAIIAPFATTSLKETVSELTLDSSGNATVTWSGTLNGTALAVGSSVSIPSGLKVPNTYLILAQVSYNYDPTFGYVLTKTITLSDQSYMSPRQAGPINRVSP